MMYLSTANQLLRKTIKGEGKMKQEPDGISLNLLAGFYDRLTFTEKSKFRKNQIKLVDIRKGEKVLDVGCGTGALSILGERGSGLAITYLTFYLCHSERTSNTLNAFPIELEMFHCKTPLFKLKPKPVLSNRSQISSTTPPLTHAG